jgi:hypothetical protein
MLLLCNHKEVMFMTKYEISMIILTCVSIVIEIIKLFKQV